MRFTIFGEAEGVSASAEQSLWASARDGIVSDASLSARNQGVALGMPVKVAQALVADLSVYEEPTEPTPTIQKIWDLLCSYSPWLETIDKRRFFLQVPGQQPPLREVRRLLADIDRNLSDEQRVRIGIAENPFLAQALVWWSRLERVPGARYYKVGRQQWLVSPALARWGTADAAPAFGHWVQRLPVPALWTLTGPEKTALQKLGIHRLGELRHVSRDELSLHFGKDARWWLRFLEPQPGGVIHVNYPPAAHRQVWRADIGDDADMSAFPEILSTLVESLARGLQRISLGATKTGMVWETDVAQGRFERIVKKAAYTSETLFAALSPGLAQATEGRLKYVEVFAEDIRPLASVQPSFVLKDGAFVPVEEHGQNELGRLMYQMNRKFPRGLQVGAKPTFRELRLQAVLGG